jgi:hypothetical protein
MKHAPKTVCTTLTALVLALLCLARPAGALGSPIDSVIAPFEAGLVSLGQLLEGWFAPDADFGTVSTKCSDPEPPEGEEDDTCGSGSTQDPNGTPTGSGTGGGGAGSGNPGG